MQKRSSKLNSVFFFSLCSLCLCGSTLISAEPWTTARGNPQRTGCIDNQAGPASPKVLWVYHSKDHFLATPVPYEDRLYVAGLGGFNVSTLLALPLDSKDSPKPIWSRSTPLLKLPVVSSPAIADDKLVFGDGMHQTDGAVLHCLRKDGMPLWYLRLDGNLVHLEGAPVVAGKRVYIGGGAAGVVCVERDRATLEGKELDEAAMQKIIESKWKELQAKYEEDKKKDPDFAVPPDPEQLPKPAPVRVWQQGPDKWHVDAPVNVVGDNVLVTSAFLEKEKVGDRAVFCLDAANGNIRWRQPLNINPWSGASVAEKTVIVAGSSVNFDPGNVKGAKGEIAAFDLATGKPLWHKDVPGGVFGSVALAEGVAVTCATDGKVRAYDISSGERRWIYDAKAAIFAPPAVVGGVIYAGDMNGVLHAITLADGKGKWKLDFANDPAIKSPGSFFCGPIVHGGKVYAATCNLDGPFARQPTVVACIGSK
jgi:outer membrane protein assembly factor BamB